MNWQDHQTLAAAYRDQGLADYLAARVVLQVSPVLPLRTDVDTSLAHLVIAKCHQASEKLFKGYRLWHDGSFKPTVGHNPLADALPHVGQPGASAGSITDLVAAVNRADSQLVRELQWLEGMAPRTPVVPAGMAGGLQPLTLLVENSEYPYWSAGVGRLTFPASQLKYDADASRALRALTAFCRVLAASDPPQFSRPVKACLSTYRTGEPIDLDEARRPHGLDGEYGGQAHGLVGTAWSGRRSTGSMTATPFIWIAGGLQLLIASANIPAARMFRCRESLRAVPAHVAEVFWAQNVFIVLTVLGTAGLCFAFAGDLAGGSRSGRAVSGYLAVFWAVRLGFQLLFYDRAMRRRYRTFDVLFVAAFAYLIAVFTAAAAGVARRGPAIAEYPI